MTIRSRTLIALLAAVAVFASVTPAQAATSSSNNSLSRNAWIPYWNQTAGIKEARQNLKSLTSVSAFGYAIDTNGDLVDKIGIDEDPWQDFMQDAQDAGVKVYATVTWFDGAALQSAIGTSKKRKKHVTKIMSVISDNPDLDGIEIDYEGKLAETKDSYSRFLSDLASKLHKKKKKLICDIEARTPLIDRYGSVSAIPSSAGTYANDFSAIGSACDEVRVMAYDQGLADVTLVRSGTRPYAPIADVAWVAKAMNLALAEIPAKKLTMGIPTYGRVYRIDAAGGYTQISSITYPDAIALAARQGQVPTRNRSGELAFSYRGLTSGLPGSATPTGVMNTYFVTFSDSVSIASHVTLAKAQGLGGVALFKLDGQTDPAFWNGFLK